MPSACFSASPSFSPIPSTNLGILACDPTAVKRLEATGASRHHRGVRRAAEGSFVLRPRNSGVYDRAGPGSPRISGAPSVAPR